jgi:hypothetical protein
MAINSKGFMKKEMGRKDIMGISITNSHCTTGLYTLRRISTSNSCGYADKMHKTLRGKTLSTIPENAEQELLTRIEKNIAEEKRIVDLISSGVSVEDLLKQVKSF